MKLKNLIKLFLIIIIALTIAYLTNLYLSEQKQPSCENFKTSTIYYACYDSSSNNFILRATQYSNLSLIGNLNLGVTNSILDLPKYNETKNYKFSINQFPKPTTITEYYNNCNKTKTLTIENCTEEDINVSANFTENVGNINISQSSPGKTIISDIISINSNNSSFGLLCKSNWQCTGWEACKNNTQKRDCIDTNHCLTPSEFPEFEKNCNCEEKWQCTWSKCINSITEATCQDLNNCNTNLAKPTKLNCNKEKDCSPNLICPEWGECKVNYNLLTLTENIQEITGIKSRVCIDQNSCISPIYETASCSLRITIYPKEIQACNKTLMGVYDNSTNQLLTILDTSEKEATNIKLLSSGKIYC